MGAVIATAERSCHGDDRDNDDEISTLPLLPLATGDDDEQVVRDSGRLLAVPYLRTNLESGASHIDAAMVSAPPPRKSRMTRRVTSFLSLFDDRAQALAKAHLVRVQMIVESPSATVVQESEIETLTQPHAAMVDPGFEERWAAWRARGARHDAAMQRSMRIVGLIAIALLGVVALRMMLNGGSL